MGRKESGKEHGKRTRGRSPSLVLICIYNAHVFIRTYIHILMLHGSFFSCLNNAVYHHPE